MPPTATLRDRYPLSPRKFWKKMIEKSIFWIICLVMLALVGVMLSIAGSPALSLPALIGQGLSVAVPILIVIMALYAWYVRVYIRRYYYDANDSFVTIKKGVFAPAEIHVQYGKIQDVYVDQDIIDRIMGLYDVHIASATVASSIEAHIDGVEAPAAEGLKEFLLGKLRGGDAHTPTPASGPTAPVSAPASFAREVSSATYPITNTWLIEQAVAWIFSSAVYAILLDVWLVLPGKNDTPSVASFFGFTSGTFWSIGLAMFAIIYILHLLYAVLWRSTFSFAFLPDYIVLKRGIIAKNETHLPYRAVQDVTVSQGIIERLFGLATVRIENAAQMVAAKGRRASSALRLPGQPLGKANEISEALKKVALSHSSAGTGL